MKYYLGIDNGGTTTKAALYDEKGKECHVASCETKMYVPQVNFCERDMEEMWQANCQVIREVMAATGVAPEDIKGIACCGHGKGLYLWGKNGKPAAPGILSADNRAFAYPVKWEQDGTAEKLYALTCQSILSCQPVSILAWIKDNRPELVEEVQYIFSCKDYVRFRLTGEAYGEVTDFSGGNLLNLHTRTYDPEIFRLLGISEFYSALPPLKNSSDLCGVIGPEAAKETGLLPGTPVAGGMFDIDACALAVGAAVEERICMIAGTWSINEYVRREPVLDGSVRLNSLFALPEYYLIEESSPTSTANHRWFIEQMLPEAAKEAKQQGKSIYQVTNEWVESIPPEEMCPIFLPFLFASNVHPNAKGSFVGIHASHTRAHLTRALYEGIVFCHRYHLEKLLKSRTTLPTCIRLAGGAAKSPMWVQMFADVCGFPVEVAKIGETGTFGCAITAAVALGDYEDYNKAADALVQIGERTEPRPAYAKVYQAKYEAYCKVIEALDGVWDTLYDLTKWEK